MMKFQILILFTSIVAPAFNSCASDEGTTDVIQTPDPSQVQYTMPNESDLHEGTWLQWPHQYQHGISYRNDLDETWVAMTNALQSTEKVHIIAYDVIEQARIIDLLKGAGVSLANVDFKIHRTDDVWVRDNGPIYVRDAQGKLVIEDWGFNGWGGKYESANCDVIPSVIGADTGVTVLNLNNIMVNEGGSVELDGHGVLMATKSSIISQKPKKSVRNKGMAQAQAELNFTKYLGATKFIWLEGGFSEEDVTDMHIDGIVKFASDNKMITMSDSDLSNWGLSDSDITILNAASNIKNEVYTKVILPLTKRDVTTKTGIALGYKGSYINFYVANGKVLVPNYNDPNDIVANKIIEGLYPGRKVIGIDVRNLYANGGMVHCVAQQQPQ
ncbi:agmatine deiminase family protein [Flavobacterium sp. EDS]|uniref:agmatine deiminase family protein n=1 Tax=Flavobacterium sp. EDS TaxID=2897328 RepID=UPI001E2ABB63|nr:agmatine deiminase family protein [Flavobacterium sp. EDS]MCD0473883.1 agmatine deiminase family protein [Flavobacterium sp. EDS]